MSNLGKVYHFNFADMTLQVYPVVRISDDWICFRCGAEGGAVSLKAIPNRGYHYTPYYYKNYLDLRAKKASIYVYSKEGVLLTEEFTKSLTVPEMLTEEYIKLHIRYINLDKKIYAERNERKEIRKKLRELATEYYNITGECFTPNKEVEW